VDLAADPLVTLFGPVVCPEAVRRRPPLAPFSLGAIVSNDSTSELSAVAEALLFVAELLDARLLCRPCVVRILPYSTYPCDVVDGRLAGGSHEVLASRLREALEGVRAPMVAPDGGSCLSVEVLTGRATTAAAYAALGLAADLAKRGARGATRRSGRWTALPDVEEAAGGVVVPHGVAAADGGDAGAAAAVPGGGGGDGGGGDGGGSGGGGDGGGGDGGGRAPDEGAHGPAEDALRAQARVWSDDGVPLPHSAVPLDGVAALDHLSVWD